MKIIYSTLFLLLSFSMASQQILVEVNSDEPQCQDKAKFYQKNAAGNELTSEDKVQFQKVLDVKFIGAEPPDYLSFAYLENNENKQAKFKYSDLIHDQEFFTIDDNGKLTSAQGFSKVLKYPYHITMHYKDDLDSCTLIIGKESNASQPLTENILANVNWERPYPVDLKQLAEKAIIEKGNAVMFIDGSPLQASSSALYRYGKKHKPVKFLRKNDFLTIQLININKYKYGIAINDMQEDFTYSRNDVGTFLPGTTSSSGEDLPEVAGTGSGVEIIKEHALIADSLNRFIEFVKNQPIPSSVQLEKNKSTIYSNAKRMNLLAPEQIDKIYYGLDPDDQEKLKSVFVKAKSVQQLLREIKLLDYTIVATILPIQIQSYDKFKLEVTLKDREGNQIGRAREYVYPIKRGVKVDQSYGLVAHGLFSEEYSLKERIIQDTTLATRSNGEIIKIGDSNGGESRDSISAITDVTKKEIIDDQSDRRLALGASTITHFFYRMGDVNFGPGLGVAVDVLPETKVRFLLGGSLMYSDGRHRVSLDFGLATGKVDVLSNTYSVGELIDSSITTVPLVEKVERSFYLGLSYNVPLARTETQSANE